METVYENNDNLNVTFYKIVSNDINVHDIYVGKTKCFKSRKCQHQKLSETCNSKLYKYIRNHNGWTNWSMIEIANFTCKNSDEIKQIEQTYCNILNATLNTSKIWKKKFTLSDIVLKKILSSINAKDGDEKTEEITTCEYCNKTFISKKVLSNHQKTAKFCLIIQGKIVKEEREEEIYMCGYCYKTFSTKYILDTHSDKCKVLKKSNDIELVNKIIHLEKQLVQQEENYKEQLANQIHIHKEQLANQIHIHDEKNKEQLTKYEIQIKELQDTIKEICVKALTVEFLE